MKTCPVCGRDCLGTLCKTCYLAKVEVNRAFFQELAKEGLTQTEIAKRLGISRQRIFSLKNETGIEIKKKVSPRCPNCGKKRRKTGICRNCRKGATVEKTCAYCLRTYYLPLPYETYGIKHNLNRSYCSRSCKGKAYWKKKHESKTD